MKSPFISDFLLSGYVPINPIITEALPVRLLEGLKKNRLT